MSLKAVHALSRAIDRLDTDQSFPAAEAVVDAFRACADDAKSSLPHAARAVGMEDPTLAFHLDDLERLIGELTSSKLSPRTLERLKAARSELIGDLAGRLLEEARR